MKTPAQPRNQCTCGATRLLLKLHLSEDVFVYLCATCIQRAQTGNRWKGGLLRDAQISAAALIPLVLEVLVDLFSEEVKDTWGLDPDPLTQLPGKLEPFDTHRRPNKKP